MHSHLSSDNDYSSSDDSFKSTLNSQLLSKKSYVILNLRIENLIFSNTVSFVVEVSSPYILNYVTLSTYKCRVNYYNSKVTVCRFQSNIEPEVVHSTRRHRDSFYEGCDVSTVHS